jgi:hypothetical protein
MPTADVGKGLTPSDGAKLSFFITGTSTPKDTFTTEAATTPNANPVIADSNGVFPDIFISGTYKVTLTDKNDVQSGFGEADPVSETVGVGDANNDKRYGPIFATVAAMVAANPVSIDGVVVNIVAGMTVSTQGYTTAGDDGGHSYLAKSSGSPDELGDHTASNGVILFIDETGPKMSKRYGIISDGVANDTTAIVAWLARRGDLYLQKGTGATLITPPISVLGDTQLTFEEGAKFKAAATASHVLGVTSAGENIVLTNPEVDGDNIRGLNGFGFSSNTTNGKNITVNNPIARNCLRSSTTGGGRGIAIQDGIESISIVNPKVYDCTTGYDVNGNTTTIDPVTGVLITNAYGENLEELISCFSDGVGNNTTVPPTQPNTVQAHITSIFGRNVGRSTDTTLYSGGGVAGDKDGGILVSRRGRNLRIGKLTVFNDNTFTIGALFRGTGNNIQIDDFEFWGNCDALAIIGSADNLLPLTNTNDSSYGLRIKGRHHGAATNLVDVRASAVSTIITSCDFDFEVDEFVTSNSILATIGTFRDDSFMKVVNVLNQRIVVGSLLEIFTNRNTLALLTKQVTVASDLALDGDLITGTSSRIDYSSTSGSSGASEGFVLVKVAGVTKKIEFFAV